MDNLWGFVLQDLLKESDKDAFNAGVDRFLESTKEVTTVKIEELVHRPL